MKLEAGKWYRTRSGTKVRVDYVSEKAYQACGHDDAAKGLHLWWCDGCLVGARGEKVPGDIVSEWTEPAVGSNAWANSLPVGAKIRWHTWPKGDHVSRIASGWEKSCQNLRHPGETGGPSACATGWRIYTEPKLRQWRHDEVPLGAWFMMEERLGRYLITGVRESDLIVSGLGPLSCEQAFKLGKHSTDNGATWLPCGVADV